jgi:hypothetical protein
VSVRELVQRTTTATRATKTSHNPLLLPVVLCAASNPCC